MQLRVEVTCALRRTHPTLLPPHESSAFESWSNMRNEEDPPYPTPQLVISSWELKWHEQWGGPTLPYCPLISHQQLRVEVTWPVRRNHPTLLPSVTSSWELKWHDEWGGPTLPYAPISHHAVESWNDMSNEENPLFPTPNGHQQLRVEITCATRRTHSTLCPHQ